MPRNRSSLFALLLPLALAGAASGCKRGAGAGQNPDGDPLARDELRAATTPAQRERLDAAEAAYEEGDDAAASEGFAALLAQLEPGADAKDLVRIRLAMSLARAGKGDEALAALEGIDPALEGLASAAARAQAQGHSQGAGPAASALGSPEAIAAWHDLWALAEGAADAGTAAFARERAARAWGSADTEARVAAVGKVRDAEARRCLELRSREARASEAKAKWQRDCVPAAPVVGVMLPRSGRFAVLADRHLSALAVGMRLVTPDMGDSALLFEDTGSTPQGARDAAERLIGRGATVLIGPVSEAEGEAVVAGLGGRAELILPGPGVRGSRGMAPSLEARVDALLDRGHARGCLSRGLLVMRAEGAYGERARRRAEEVRQQGSSNFPDVQTNFRVVRDLSYPGQATSFAPILKPAAADLAKRPCVLVLDTLARTEAIARQMRRDGREIGPTGLTVLSLAEGLDAGALAGRKALAGVEVAPVALPDARSAFQDAYRVATGRAADDQALLVWRALRLALWGLPPPAGVPVAHFDASGQLVNPGAAETEGLDG